MSPPNLDHIPDAPGCYLMKGADGEIIYVGKAANLRARVRQYFGNTSDTRFFVSLLDRYLDDIEVIITANAKEALILENELIKRHQPRFNVELKDDKSFLHLRIDERAAWPRIDVVRRPKRDGARYFGPYDSASKIRETLRLVERHFQLRTCDDASFRNRSRPCLQHQIKRCPAPCVLPVDEALYRQNVRDVALFLQGRHAELLDALRQKMQAAAADLAFERAAHYRDQVRAIEGSLTPQQIVSPNEIDRDVVGLYREGGLLQIVLLFVRRGRMIGSRGFGYDEQGTPDAEVLSTFLNLYYHAGNTLPHEVLLPDEIDDAAALAERLSELKGRRVELRVPQRGAGRRLIEMAARNAEHAFFQARRDNALRDGGLVRLRTRLRLSVIPYRIECFDISLFQGEAPVASRVVFEAGVPKPSEYRRYRIKTVEGMDDFAMMREVLTRRLSRGIAEGDLPDLLVVDGGKGQLGVAQAVCQDLGLDAVDLCGLAKSRVLDAGGRGDAARSAERVFRPGVREPIRLLPHTDELFIMTRLRDEAHRFAITFHRQSRGAARLQSALDEVPGVGPARKRALLRAFGSVSRIASADEEAVAAVEGIGPRLARLIIEHIRPSAATSEDER